ncbi:MAG: hypothetical protein WCT18_01860 [Patescibacteria group bacterium]
MENDTNEAKKLRLDVTFPAGFPESRVAVVERIIMDVLSKIRVKGGVTCWAGFLKMEDFHLRFVKYSKSPESPTYFYQDFRAFDSQGARALVEEFVRDYNANNDDEIRLAMTL